MTDPRRKLPSASAMKTLGQMKLKQYLAPGIWEDTDGNVHISLPDVLANRGLRDTPENRAIAEAVIRKTLAELMPDTKVVSRS